MAVSEPSGEWYVMRDLKRPNALEPAYSALQDMGFRVFTPMQWRTTEVRGRRSRRRMPVVPDLLFVCALRADLDAVVTRTPTLQYRFVKGQAFGTPMTVRPDEMDMFMQAVEADDEPRYYSPAELTEAMCGARVRLLCDGPLNCCEGRLHRIGTRGRRRILISLSGLLAASVAIPPTARLELLG